MHDQDILKTTRNWVESVVIDLNLCPFAAREFNSERVRFRASEAGTTAQLLTDLQHELSLLEQDNNIETSLLIHPGVLQAFGDFNQFLDLADDLLLQMQLEGIFQIASFHPAYQFAETDADDTSNYTNRSPYPMLHLIREASLERAIANYPDVAQIPERNIARLEKMGHDKVLALWQACFVEGAR